MISRLKTYLQSDSDGLNEHRYLVIPDLHGVYSIYKKVEKYIKSEIELDRKVIFLGDYVDRGEEGEVFGKKFNDVGSYLIVRDLIELQKWAKELGRDIIFLKGNHELLFEQRYIHKIDDTYKEYDFLVDSMECFDYVFSKEPLFYDKFISFLSNLSSYYLDHKYKYLFVHAGIDPDKKSLQEQIDSEDIYWIRDKFLFSTKKLDYTVIFGHTPFIKPFMKRDKIGLDSGVYKRDFLNLLLIDNSDSRVLQLYK